MYTCVYIYIYICVYIYIYVSIDIYMYTIKVYIQKVLRRPMPTLEYRKV